jgi:hypothetical protein
MKKCSIIFGLLFIFFSCSDDPLISEQENYNSVEHAQKWFEQNVNISSPPNGRISSRPKNVSWENGISYVKDKTQTVEVPIQYETELIAYPQSINKNASYKNLTKLLMFDDGKGGYNIFVMRIMPDIGSVPELAKNTYDKKTNSFSGDIIYYTWEGKPLVHTRYENGKRAEWNYIEQTSKTEDTSGARTTNECYRIEVEWYSVTCSAYGCGDPIYLYSDYYYFCSGGSSPYTDEYEDPGDLYGGGGGGNGDSGWYSPTAWEEEKIDDSQLKPCMQKILTDIKNLTQGSVGQIIQKFSGSVPGWNWELKDGALSGGTGNTDPPALYNKTTGTVTTTFDSQAWPDATELSWARTILHESVHAYLSVYFATDQQNFIKSYPQMVQVRWSRKSGHKIKSKFVSSYGKEKQEASTEI